MSNPVNPYGQQQPQPPHPYAAPTLPAPSARGRRPGTVTAAGVIAIVMSVLTVGFALLMVAVITVARDEMLAEMRRQPDWDELGVDAETFISVMLVGAVVVALLGVVGAVLGGFTLARSVIARILLVILSAFVALVSLLAIMSIISIVPLVMAVLTIVLLFTGGANDWFARREPAMPPAAPGGQAPYGQAPYGQAPYGQAPYGQPSAPQAPYGQPAQPPAPAAPREEPPLNAYGQPVPPPADEPGPAPDDRPEQ